MAMKFREPNEVRWVGVRPAHRGTQVKAHGMANNGTVTIYTVSAGKTLFVTAMHVFMRCTSGTSANSIIWRDNKNDVWFVVGRPSAGAAGQAFACVNYNPPFEVPAGCYLTVSTDQAAAYLSVSIVGWEE